MAVVQTLQRPVNVQQTDKTQKEGRVPNLINYLGICLEKPRKSSIEIYGISPKFEPRTPEYEAGVQHTFYNREEIY